MDAQLRYTQMGFEILAAIDRGASLDPGELREQIDSGSFFQWLREKEPDIDQSLYLDEDRTAMLRFFQRRGDVADARRKYGVEENGLGLLAAYCFEGLERAGREGSTVEPPTAPKPQQPLRSIQTIIRAETNSDAVHAILSEVALWPAIGSVIEVESGVPALVRNVRMKIDQARASIIIEVEKTAQGKD